MHIRPRHHNGSQPDRRRLSTQVRPRAETKTETGAARASLVARVAPERTEAGEAGGHYESCVGPAG